MTDQRSKFHQREETTVTAIQQFSSSQPGVTELPIVEDEDGTYYGWGHLDRTAFIDAVHAIEVHWKNMGPEDRESIGDDEVEYVWAVHDPHNDERWLWVDEGAPEAVPITVIDLCP